MSDKRQGTSQFPFFLALALALALSLSLSYSYSYPYSYSSRRDFTAEDAKEVFGFQCFVF